MSSPVAQHQIESRAGAAQALQATSRAIQEAQRAYDARILQAKSFQPPAGDLQSLDLAGWKRHAALSLFKLGDRRVLYTDGRDVARSRPTVAGGIDVRVSECINGDTVSMPAETLLQPSVKWLAGVVTVGKRKGAHARTLRARNAQAFLSPCPDAPLAQRPALALGVGAVAGQVPMDKALKELGLKWMPTVGADGDDSDASQDSEADGTAIVPEGWLEGDGESATGMQRAAALHTLGVADANGEGVLASQLALFACGAADAHGNVAAVAHAIEAATTPEADGGGDERFGQAAAAAGLACREGVRAIVDALAASGAAAVLRRARRMREELGAPAGLAARGAMAAQELRLLAQRESTAARVSPERPLRRSPRGALAPPGQSPRSDAIRRLIDERAAERSTALTPGTSRTLDFDGPAGDAGGEGARKRGAPDTALDAAPGSQRRRAAGTSAPEFVELRPAGEEAAPLAAVIAALERAMAGPGRLGVALAECAGRPEKQVAMLAPESAPAQRAAAADWRAVLDRAGMAAELRAEGPPRDWAEAADRLMEVL